MNEQTPPQDSSHAQPASERETADYINDQHPDDPVDIGRIVDPKMAWEMGYAEKPHMDEAIELRAKADKVKSERENLDEDPSGTSEEEDRAFDELAGQEQELRDAADEKEDDANRESWLAARQYVGDKKRDEVNN